MAAMLSALILRARQIVLVCATRLGLFLDDSLLLAWRGFVVSLRPFLVGRLFFASICPNDTLALVI
ncbi:MULTISPECIES: hypothetical protein [unclassified Afipia]|uniref:hypothetical protein n=1 Tax=unclassified Afipia TaxID=2642050 RepID=UPI000409EB38|nr:MULTISPECIES: hypothetical protein [unclassified Afipia]